MSFLTLRRYAENDEATMGMLHYNGKFMCYVLEDQYQSEKVWGETRIPKGTYNIGLRTIGGFHTKYAKKFPTFHNGMLHIQDVPNFEYILIHIGNTDEHTAGCLLVGAQAVTPHDDDFKVLQSAYAYKDLYQKVWKDAFNNNLLIDIREDLL